VTQRFSTALAEFGYPPCPGQIMLTNPLWCQPLGDFKETIRRWVYGRSHAGAMHLAIFFDAAAVAGDESLLVEAKAFLDRALGAEAIFLARFAAAADQFSEGGHWLQRLTTPPAERRMDLKKLGTFPIVHGVRALSLEYGVREPGTAARLQRLAQAGALAPGLAAELTQALHVLMGLRLSHQLQQRAAGLQPGNEVRMGDLQPPEREKLSGALATVRRFRLFLRQHFRFDLL
jgi:CBS domain-containing protein